MRRFITEPSRLGECPTWDERGRRFWWIDVTGKRLSSVDGDGGDLRRQGFDDYPGSFGLRATEGVVIAFRRGVATFDGAGRQVAANPLPAEVVKRERFNDGACDSRGRFWAGTMDKELREPVGGLYRIDPDLSMHRMTDGIRLSNGIAWSPDDRLLYHCDSTPPRVYVHDFDAEAGTVTNRRVLVEFDEPTMGKADGCAVDTDGFIWVAAPRTSKVFRFAPDGRLDRWVETPTRFPTSVAFGGDGWRTMFITSYQSADPAHTAEPEDGLVYATDAGVAGMPTPRFAG